MSTCASSDAPVVLRIRHATRFVYDRPAYESHNEIRMMPWSGPGQHCVEAELEVTPTAAVLPFEDAFGNRVHAVSVHPPHDALEVVVTSTVERVPLAAPRPARVAFAEYLADDDARSREHFEFLNPSRYVPFSDRLRRFFWASRPDPSEGVPDYVVRVLRSVRDQFEYETGTTHVHSSVDDVLAAGGGVCQDFAHLTIGCLRLAGLPARYVSGYLAPGDDAPRGPVQASHAWVEVNLPGSGWTAYDPTHRGPITMFHVRVAVGRDYADASPMRGVYRSAGDAARMTVALDVVPETNGRGLTGEAGASTCQQQ
jgi:transglutaminase-like putative cysteine protease